MTETGSTSWTFSAAAGNSIFLGITEIGANTVFKPEVRLLGTDGTQLTYNFGNVSTEIHYTAPTTGTYTAVVDSAWTGVSFTANYVLALAVAGQPFSPGDDGGGMTNGSNYSGTAYPGDLDMWSINAAAGSTIQAGLTEVNGNTPYWPEIYLFAPDGSQLTYQFNSALATEIIATAPVSGTYTVLVDDGNATNANSVYTASYTLNAAVSPGAFSISNGDQGGTMVNGGTYPGTITPGDLDIWNFGATANDAIALNILKVDGNTPFVPEIYLYGPDGSQIAYQDGDLSAAINATAPTTGTYTVVVDDWYAQRATSLYTGSYTLTVSGITGLPPVQISKIDGSQEGRPGCACVADPITLATGNVFEQVTDYQTTGQNQLAFRRYYNSLGYQSSTFATTLGTNWRSTFDRYLRLVSASSVIAERADGQQFNFTLVGSIWTPDSDVDITLTNTGSIWTLTDHDDTVETYTAAGSEAVLNSIKLRNGYTQILTYTGGQLHTVTDSYGRTLTLTYDAGLLDTVSTPDSLVLTYGFTAVAGSSVLTSVAYNTIPATSITYAYGDTGFPFALTSLTDENGNLYSSWTYDGQGRATENWQGPSATPRINDTQVSYDDSTGNRTVTGPLGIQETYKFTTLQGVPKVTEIDRAANGTVTAATRLFTYDSNGYQNTATDWDGNFTRYMNNSHGQPTEIDEAVESAVARSTYFVYDTTWVHLPHTITTPGLTSTLNYDTPTGNLLTRVDADTTSQTVPYTTNGQTRTTTYTWTATGQLQTVQLPRTDVTAKTTYGYTGGTLTSITDALGHATNVTGYTGSGLPQTVTDPNSVLTTLAYDGRLRLNTSVLTVSGGALTTTYTHDAAENLTKVTLPDGSYLAYTYDNAHRVTQIENKLNQPIPLTLDAKGDTTQTLWENSSNVVKRQHSATFDALGRMLTDVGGVGQTTTYGYDSQGNVTSITDPLNNVTSQTPDALNRLQTITDPLKHSTGYTYDAHDRPLTVTDPNGHATSFVYDGFGEAIQQTSPDTGTTVYHYDSDGNLTSKTDAGSVVTNYSYDADDRPLTRTYPADTTLNVSFTYDQAGSHGKGVGRLTSLIDATGTLSLTYDARGNLLTSARVLGGATYTTSYSYDNANRISSITYPKSGWLVGYTRDGDGEITAVSAKPPSASGHSVASAIAHLPYGPPSSLTWGNGVTDLRAFDKDYRMTQVADTGAALLLKLTYGYYADNSVYTITDGVTAANDETFGYDLLRRLSGARGSYGSHSYTYDNNGNRTAIGGTKYTIDPSSNKVTAIGGAPVLYTLQGNIYSIGSTASMTYNAANQLKTSTEGGNSGTYTYDAFGQRLKIQPPSAPLQVYQYDQQGNLLTETDNSIETDYVYLDGTPVATITPSTSTINYLHTDRQGTPQLATNASKAAVWSATYDPFGNTLPSGSITQNLRLPGQYADNTGFSHNGTRDYNPTMGRYLESDPIGLSGGLNTYAYALSNPTKWMDRSGLQSGPNLNIILDSGKVVRGGLEMIGAIATAPLAGTGFGAIIPALIGGDGAINMLDGITQLKNDLLCHPRNEGTMPTLPTLAGQLVSQITGIPELNNSLSLYQTFSGFTESPIDKMLSTLELLEDSSEDNAPNNQAPY